MTATEDKRDDRRRRSTRRRDRHAHAAQHGVGVRYAEPFPRAIGSDDDRHRRTAGELGPTPRRHGTCASTGRGAANGRETSRRGNRVAVAVSMRRAPCLPVVGWPIRRSRGERSLINRRGVMRRDSRPSARAMARRTAAPASVTTSVACPARRRAAADMTRRAAAVVARPVSRSSGPVRPHRALVVMIVARPVAATTAGAPKQPRGPLTRWTTRLPRTARRASATPTAEVAASAAGPSWTRTPPVSQQMTIAVRRRSAAPSAWLNCRASTRPIVPPRCWPSVSTSTVSRPAMRPRAARRALRSLPSRGNSSSVPGSARHAARSTAVRAGERQSRHRAAGSASPPLHVAPAEPNRSMLRSWVEVHHQDTKTPSRMHPGWAVR